MIEFFTSKIWLGNIHLTWDVVSHRFRLGGLTCSLKSFLQLNKCQELQISAFVSMCVFGCKLSLVRLCDCDFGITLVDNITIWITCAAFCFHITRISFAISWYLFCLSVIVLARLCVFGDNYVYGKGVLCFLFHKTMSGRLKHIVLFFIIIILFVIIIFMY